MMVMMVLVLVKDMMVMMIIVMVKRYDGDVFGEKI